MNRQQTFLREMGYTLWQMRQPLPADAVEGLPEHAERLDAVPPLVAASPATAREAPPSPSPPPPPSSLPAIVPGAPARNERAIAIARMDWQELGEAIRECRACPLCQHRKQAVPGVGDREADWLFIGEGPGAEEDRQGEPFVGQAGKLLDAMLTAIGMKRGENVYIANAVKCRPEGHRTPLPGEMTACRPFLLRQIALIEPRLIVLLGKAAVHTILGIDTALAALRRKTHCFGDIPVVVTYHPAYLLRNLPEKVKAWEDLCLARRTIRGG
jgi:DNA polymerase